MNYKAVRSIVRSMVGDHYTHRYQILSDTVGAGTVEYKPLLLADDDPDYDIAPNATTPRECESGSKITGIDMMLNLAPVSAGTPVQWAIWKNPDQLLGTSLNPNTIFENDINADTIVFRKYCLAYGFFRNTTSRESKMQHVRISKAALGRSSRMRENDLLGLSVYCTGANVTLDYFGRIWTLES